MNIQSVNVKKEYYQAIKNHLQKIQIYFTQIESQEKVRKSNIYNFSTGFTQEVQYSLILAKKDSGLIYSELNQILKYLRQGQAMTYALYVKDIKGNQYRYEVKDKDEFVNIVQANTFNMEQDLKNYCQNVLDQLENQKELSKHIEEFFKAVDMATSDWKSKISQADKYEGFEYHYQKRDFLLQSYTHGFNIQGIRNWYFARGHDTLPWFSGGDVDLTSVKSVDLQNKHVLLSISSKKSMEQVYSLIQSIFSSSTLSQKNISDLVKAFTPAVQQLKKGASINVKEIVEDLILSLTKKI